MEYFFRKKNGTIKVSLPADIRKEGSAYDLTLAIGILAASEQIAGAAELEDYFILGELSLDGSLQPIRGALPIALEARKRKKKGVILPIQNAREAAIVDGIDVLGASDIKQVIDFFDKGVPIEPTRIDVTHAFNDSLDRYEYASIISTRPFRAPHHTISDVALVGGGPHHRRPRRQPEHRNRPPQQGHQFPESGPGQLGEKVRFRP